MTTGSDGGHAQTINVCLLLKIARLGSSQNLMDTAKLIDLACLCIQMLSTVVFFFQSYTHQTLKNNPNQKTVNRKY